MSLARPLTLLRWIALGLAAMHLLPATHHLGDFFANPSLADAWKGFGAVGAIVVLLLPAGVQARVAKTLWKHRLAGVAVSVVLVIAHLVPAADHLPTLLVALSWGDAWRGIGAAIAITWFVAPRGAQIALVRKLGYRNERTLAPTAEQATRKLSIAFVIGAVIWLVLAVSSTGFAA